MNFFNLIFHFFLTKLPIQSLFFLFSHPPSERERKDNTFSILSKLLSLLFLFFFLTPISLSPLPLLEPQR